jgi:SpoVK/Ycf46/Vps4 family AAA+-type ATPase
MISKYMAKNSNMNYVMMSGGDLAQYIQRGEHVTEINKLFNTIQNSNSPTILFIDECESLCGDRGKMDRSQLIELVNAFLNKTGEPSKKLMVILTTNRKEDLDPAVLSRMDHKLYIGPPEENERRIIIEQNISTFMTKEEKTNLFTHEVISDIARRTEGFTGRTLFKIFNTLAGLRASSVENTLTLEMVEETLQAFIEQEGQMQD